jgi:hypothetical protein
LNQFACDSPSKAVDIIGIDGSAKGSASLSAARGWPSVCVTNSKQVIFAGGGAGEGGKSGGGEHSSVADVIDSGHHVQSYLTAITGGKWGVSCVTSGDHVYFAGGSLGGAKSVRRTTEDFVVYDSTTKAWSADKSKTLSTPRESIGATVNGDALIFAGGVAAGEGVPNPGLSKEIDIFSKFGRKTLDLPTGAYWPGAVTVNGVTYVVSNEKIVALEGVDTASPKLGKTAALPSEIAGPPSLYDGGSIPGAHVAANGVAIGHLACFYSYKPSAMYCYNTETGAWTHKDATAMHRGGAIAVVGTTIAVAGGFDTRTNKTTSVIDIFQVSF